MVYGGNFRRNHLNKDFIERKNLNSESGFEVLNLQNEKLLETGEKLTFFYEGKFLILGYLDKYITTFDPKTNKLEQTDYYLQSNEAFIWSNPCFLENGSIYMLGKYHVHVFNKNNKSIRRLRDQGIINY